MSPYTISKARAELVKCLQHSYSESDWRPTIEISSEDAETKSLQLLWHYLKLVRLEHNLYKYRNRHEARLIACLTLEDLTKASPKHEWAIEIKKILIAHFKGDEQAVRDMLEHLLKHPEEIDRRTQTAKAKLDRRRKPLRNLIDTLLRRNPDLTFEDLRVELIAREGGPVVVKVTDDDVEVYLDDSENLNNTRILKNGSVRSLLSTAKKIKTKKQQH
jgi:hypothetical protein